MKFALACATLTLIVATTGTVEMRPADAESAKPQYSGDKLARPEGYREWIYLSSGLGMNYNAGAMEPELFTNVFVVPWAYRAFVATGKWPEKSIFVVEDH
jgi:hypothetical protein